MSISKICSFKQTFFPSLFRLIHDPERLTQLFVNFYKKYPHPLFESKTKLDQGFKLGGKKNHQSEDQFPLNLPRHTLPRAIRGDATQPTIRSIFYITRSQLKVIKMKQIDRCSRSSLGEGQITTWTLFPFPFERYILKSNQLAKSMK